MSATLLKRNRRATVFGMIAGSVLVVLAGALCLPRFGDGLARASYDLPFVWSARTVPDNLVMIYVDAKVKTSLGQPPDAPLDRSFYTKLLERLTADGARLVVFDILFDTPHANPRVDEAFATAMRQHGRVVLAADEITQFQGDTVTSSVLPPIDVLAQAAAGWGLARVPVAADLAVREISRAWEPVPSLSQVAASVLNSPATMERTNDVAGRWLNYYCPPTALRAVNLDHALQADGLPLGFFRDKIVFVGGRAGEAGIAGAARDEFSTPYSRAREPAAPGAAIQAFSLLNLVHGDWLSRFSFPAELTLVGLWGLLAATGLMLLRPWTGIVAAIVAAVGLAVGAIYVQARHELWFNWLALVAVQTPVALIWAVGFQYLLEARRREKLRKAFAAYYSPYMADKIAESDFDLSLGGKEVEATIMFTDLEGFTAMSETLPPAELSRLLTTYFTETTQAIFEHDGMIIKYIGDSVMAVWGAPMSDPKPAERAVLAALGMRQAGLKEFRGRRLRTRIGINTGNVLAGNLGSEYRFDYTLIGEATNLASRLESLNKYLGTDILISEATRASLKDDIQLRALGRFIVAGKTQPVNIYEVLGATIEFTPPPEWLSVFARGLTCFQMRELDEAAQLMQRVSVLRGEGDGPANFYLKEIEKARARLPGDRPWDGIVVFESK